MLWHINRKSRVIGQKVNYYQVSNLADEWWLVFHWPGSSLVVLVRQVFEASHQYQIQLLNKLIYHEYSCLGSSCPAVLRLWLWACQVSPCTDKLRKKVSPGLLISSSLQVNRHLLTKCGQRVGAGKCTVWTNINSGCAKSLWAPRQNQCLRRIAGSRVVMEDERDSHLTRYKGFSRSNALLLSNKHKTKQKKGF